MQKDTKMKNFDFSLMKVSTVTNKQTRMPEGSFSLDSRSADKEIKVVTPEK